MNSDEITQNMRMAKEVESLLKDIRPDQRGVIYTTLLIYTAHSMNVSKQDLLNMIDHFFDNPTEQEKHWN